MAVEVKYLTSATAVFLNLQSGLARPYWEANITVSGGASTFSGTLGQAYGTNDIISMGTVDREKPVEISGLSRIFAGNVIFTLNNISGTYSPQATASIFTDGGGSAMDYMHSRINVWAGFENTSGTAYTVRRGSFLLTKVQVNSQNRTAYLHCEDAARVPLQRYVGLPGVSGTANTWTPPSGNNTKAIMSDILSGVGLSATEYNLSTGLDFPDFAVSAVVAGNTLASLAQASDGFIYTDNQGRVTFDLYSPQFAGLGGGGLSTLDLSDTGTILKTKYVIDVKNLINRVQVNYSTGLDLSRGDEDASVTKGRHQIIDNKIIDKASIANSVSSRLLSRYKENRTFLEVDNVWLPSLNIGDTIAVYDTNTYLTAKAFEIYRIREDITKFTTKIYASEDLEIGQKWAFCSDTSAVNCGTVFTDSWHSGFGFACTETATAANPGFDADGDADNVITTGHAASGAGTTGIELCFLAY